MMFARRTRQEGLAYVAALVEDALTGANSAEERAAVLARALQVAGHLSLTALQAPLQLARQQGTAPKTLAELELFVEPRRTRWLKPTRRSQRLATAKPRANRSAERMFAPDEVARELGVEALAVVRWCREGLLRCEKSEAGEPRIPASVLYGYRTGLARWQRVIGLVRAARDGEPEPAEAAIFAEVAARRQA